MVDAPVVIASLADDKLLHIRVKGASLTGVMLVPSATRCYANTEKVRNAIYILDKPMTDNTLVVMEVSRKTGESMDIALPLGVMREFIEPFEFKNKSTRGVNHFTGRYEQNLQLLYDKFTAFQYVYALRRVIDDNPPPKPNKKASSRKPRKNNRNNSRRNKMR